MANIICRSLEEQASNESLDKSRTPDIGAIGDSVTVSDHSSQALNGTRIDDAVSVSTFESTERYGFYF